jgi:hypothetical protein
VATPSGAAALRRRAGALAVVGLLAALACGDLAETDVAAQRIAAAKRTADGWLSAGDRRVGEAVSPGGLAGVHAHLERLSACTECHGAMTRTPDARCVTCHDDVAERMRAGVGFHGTLEGRCAGCHADHRGAEADLLGLDRRAFNHALAAFPLRGAHAEVKCDACHLRAARPRPGDPPAAPESAVRRFHPLGIPHDRCAACHEDPHPAGFSAGRDCGVCHGERSFLAADLQPAAEAAARAPDVVPAAAAFLPARKDLPVVVDRPGFDHNRDADFPLGARHAGVACEACHTPERRALAEARGLAPGAGTPEACGACHHDPHRDALGADCARCHGDVDWTDPEAPFDHAREGGFALDALHGALACGACHADLRFTAASRRCEGCHVDAAALLAGRADFASGAAPPPPPAADPHRALACRECHGETRADARLLAYERACTRCHAPEYGTLLLTRKRLLDGLLLDAEGRLRASELAARRGEAPERSAERQRLAATLQGLGRSGLHHPELAEALLRSALASLDAEAAR